MEKKKTNIYMFVILLITLLFIFAYDRILIVLNVFSPLFYGVIIAYLLDGMVRLLLRRLKIKRGLAVALVIVFVLLLCGVTVYYAIPFLASTIRDLVDYVSSLITEHNTGLYNMIEKAAAFFNINIDSIYKFDITKIDKDLMNTLNTAFHGVYGLTVGTVTKVGSSIVVVFTSFMLAIYMLIEKEDLLYRMKRVLIAIIPEKSENYVLGAFTMANDVFKKFIIGKAVDSLIIGLLMIVFFMLFGIEYSVVFGIIGGIGNMIPYFGPIFSAVPVVIILLIINPWHALIALIIILVVQQLDAHIIGPKILSDNIGGVSAFWILFAVTICGIAFGFMGMIFGVPIVVIIKNLVEDFANRRLEKRVKKKPVKAVETAVIKEKNEVDSDAEKPKSET